MKFTISVMSIALLIFVAVKVFGSKEENKSNAVTFTKAKEKPVANKEVELKKIDIKKAIEPPVTLEKPEQRSSLLLDQPPILGEEPFTEQERQAAKETLDWLKKKYPKIYKKKTLDEFINARYFYSGFVYRDRGKPSFNDEDLLKLAPMKRLKVLTLNALKDTHSITGVGIAQLQGKVDLKRINLRGHNSFSREDMLAVADAFPNLERFDFTAKNAKEKAEKMLYLRQLLPNVIINGVKPEEHIETPLDTLGSGDSAKKWNKK